MLKDDKKIGLTQSEFVAVIFFDGDTYGSVNQVLVAQALAERIQKDDPEGGWTTFGVGEFEVGSLHPPQIRYALDKLVKRGLIERKKAREHRFDHRYSYSFTKRFEELCDNRMNERHNTRG